tara:strand:+ start:177 stop:1955 length:1779 start_codon:yes stop_codon:yes gene_type:complete
LLLKSVLFFFSILIFCHSAKSQNAYYEEYDQALRDFENQNYDSAQARLNLLLNSLEGSEFNKIKYLSLDLLGNLSYTQSKYPASLNYYLQALKISENLKDCKLSLKSRLKIVRLNYYLGEKLKALSSLRSIEKDLVFCPDDSLKHDILYKYGVIYLELGFQDSALLALNSCLSCCESWLADKKKSQILAVLGENYWLGLKDYPKAYSAFIQAKKYAYASADLNSMAFANIKLGGFNEANLSFKEREALLDTAYQQFDSLGSIVDLIYVKRMLANLYAEFNMASKVNATYSSLWPLYDSLHSLEMRREVADLRTKYQTQQKEEDNIRLKLKTAQQELDLSRESTKNQKLVLGLGISILIGLGFSFFLIFRNKIKAQKLEREQERKTFLAMTEGEEKERIRLSKDLHDGLGQILSTARMNVNALEREDKGEEEKIWKNSLKLIDQAVVEVRNVSHALMPSALVQLGLIPAIQQISDQINDSGQIKLEFIHQGEIANWPMAIRISIFRIVQEVLNNMVKHSEASEISIHLLSDDEKMTLDIKDNGKGFDLDIIDKSKGIGWKNIQSRVKLLGAKLELYSEKSKGSQIILKLENGK